MQFPFLKRRKSEPTMELRDFVGGINAYAPMVNNNPSACSNPMLESCVSKVSTTVSSLPLHVHAHTKNGTVEAWNHWMTYLIQRPNNEETYTVFWSTVARQLSLYSNCYLRVLRYEDIPVALKIIDAKNVRVERDNYGQKLYYVTGLNEVLTSYDVLHLINPMHGYNGSIGISVIDAHRGVIETNNRIRGYLDRAVTTGMPDSVLLTPNDSWDGKTDKQEQDMVQRTFKWYNLFMKGKTRGDSDVAIAPPHMTVSTLSVPKTAEVQAMDQLKESDKLIMKLFQIPSEVMESDSKGVYNTLDTRESEFIYSAVKPICDIILQGLETLLDGPYFLQYDYEALIDTDTDKKINTLSTAINNGLMTINEGRKKLHLDAVEGMDRLILPLNKGYLGGEEDESTPKAVPETIPGEEV